MPFIAIREFEGVRDGDVYPSTIAVGDVVPDELIAAAIELGAVEEKPSATGAEKKARGAAPENKSK